jgi:thiosulfate/3-mercaptopyruvate sulfurtransferase
MALVAVAVLSPLFALPQDPGRLVSTEWLDQHKSDPDVRIVDMRYGVKFYWEDHIPGAVFLHPDALRLPERGAPERTLSPGMLASVLGQAGIDRNTMVVIYAEEIDSLAPYLIWQLDCLGHRRSAVLDGGFTKWVAEGRARTQEYPVIEPCIYQLPEKLPVGVRATLEDVKLASASGAAVLLDVRPAAQFTGDKGPWIRKGRIPGSVNRDWVLDLGIAGRLRDKDSLAAAYAALGMKPAKPVIVCCGKGLRSTNTYLVLKYLLGFLDVKVYDGGFSEWASHAELPVETGAPQK